MSTHFFEQQEEARRATRRMVALFIVAVFAIVGAVTFVVHVLTARSMVSAEAGARADFALTQFDFGVAFFTLLVIGLGSLIRMLQIGSRGDAVARMLGGREISASTRDPDERKLLNVVEEMAIASGIPVPRIYLLDQESSINAFAAGLEPTNAVIGVTRGTIQGLTRDELQGVIAHEFSHIFNGDMKLNLRLMSVVGGIMVISTVGRIMLDLLRSTRSRRNQITPVLAIFGLALLVIGYIGVFFARLIKASVSRHREYLADAAAVQYTRNPDGIGGALLKIRDSAGHSVIASPAAEEASHLFFGSAFAFTRIFATHPPLDERIRRISPALLSGSTRRRENEESTDSTAATSSLTEAIGSFSGQSEVATWPQSGSAAALAPVTITASIGQVKASSLEAARTLLSGLPEDLQAELRSPSGARAVVFGLLLQASGTTPTPTPQAISSILEEELLTRACVMQKRIEGFPHDTRLPLLELAIPALRSLEFADKRELLSQVRKLVWSDRSYNLFEFVTLKVLEHQLVPSRSILGGPTHRLSSMQGEAGLLLSALAHIGLATSAQSAPAQAAAAFEAGARFLSQHRLQVRLRAADQCSFEALDQALERLRRLAPSELEILVQAMVATAGRDGDVNFAEFELLKGACLALDCPLPLAI